MFTFWQGTTSCWDRCSRTQNHPHHPKTRRDWGRAHQEALLVEQVMERLQSKYFRANLRKSWSLHQSQCCCKRSQISGGRGVYLQVWVGLKKTSKNDGLGNNIVNLYHDMWPPKCFIWETRSSWKFSIKEGRENWAGSGVQNNNNKIGIILEYYYDAILLNCT